MKSRPNRLILLFIVLVSAAVLTGCSPRKMAIREFTAMVQTGLPAMENEDDLSLVAQSMPAHIKLLETLLVSDPSNRDLLVLLARIYGGYAFAILETEFEARQLGQAPVVAVGYPYDTLEAVTARYFQRGAEYALRALEIAHPQARLQLGRLQESETFINSLAPADVPALFWYGFNLGGFVQHRLDSVEAMAKAHLVAKTMQRVLALEPAYYHGCAHLVMLTYYGSRPPMMGGDRDEARRQFEQHQKLLPGPMGLRDLFLTRYLLVHEQARAELVRRLSAIARKPEKTAPMGLLEKVAAVRAQIYLGAVDRFFD